tara:strand:- start:10303 stop:10527 length:225 start_codon:yes stop_codon:yes gene_type:complete
MREAIEQIKLTVPPSVTLGGPWPSFKKFKGLPDREKWVIYGAAKAQREYLECRGVQMSESYDEFIKRVTRELDI